MDAKEITKIIYTALDDKKGENIKILDISNVSVIADYFIIASGNNINQVQALADNVKEELFKLNLEPKNVEGYRNASWILLDYTEVIVHIFSKDDRIFYDLERIWRDGRRTGKRVAVLRQNGGVKNAVS